jgi:hypothetical protein
MRAERGTGFLAKARHDVERAAGRPQSMAMRAKARAVSEASSAGFRTAALPMVRAAPTERPRICIG